MRSSNTSSHAITRSRAGTAAHKQFISDVCADWHVLSTPYASDLVARARWRLGLVRRAAGCDPVVRPRSGPALGEVVVDPVTLIVAALAAGASSGVSDTVSQGIKDAYTGLKALVLRRVRNQPAGEVAVLEHEKDPDTWSAPLAKTLSTAGADTDPELVTAAGRVR